MKMNNQNHLAGKQKRGNAIIICGWILIIIASLKLLGQLTSLRYPNHIFFAFYSTPSIVTFAKAFGYLIGNNALTFLSFALGLFAHLRFKHPSAPRIIIFSTFIFLFSILLYVLSFVSYARAHEDNIVTHQQSEFTVTFPHQTNTRKANINGQHTYMVESIANVMPQLRAEFTPVQDLLAAQECFEYNLKNFGYTAGLIDPQYTIAETSLGKKGTCSGVKKVGQEELRVYGITVLGDRSMIHCVIIEPLQKFPSEETVNFMDSIRKK